MAYSDELWKEAKRICRLNAEDIAPPKLYDLTMLQRDANRLLGYTAQQTLEYIQSLYEKKDRELSAF